MYTVASPDPKARGGGQVLNPNECSSTLTSATGEETLTPNRSKCNSTLTSGTGTSGGAAPTNTIYTGGEGQLPDPNECNSTLTKATKEEILTPNP